MKNKFTWNNLVIIYSAFYSKESVLLYSKKLFMRVHLIRTVYAYTQICMYIKDIPQISD